MTARRAGQWFQNGAPTALGNVGRLPRYKASPGELNRMVGNQGPNRVPPPSFLFIDPAPVTPATKEKADVSEICQYMT